jgi:hypothetical protein
VNGRKRKYWRKINKKERRRYSRNREGKKEMMDFQEEEKERKNKMKRKGGRED